MQLLSQFKSQIKGRNPLEEIEQSSSESELSDNSLYDHRNFDHDFSKNNQNKSTYSTSQSKVTQLLQRLYIYKDYFTSIPLNFIHTGKTIRLTEIVYLLVYSIFFAVLCYLEPALAFQIRKVYGSQHLTTAVQDHAINNFTKKVHIFNANDLGYQQQKNTLFFPTRLKITPNQTQSECYDLSKPCIQDQDCKIYFNDSICQTTYLNVTLLNATIINKKDFQLQQLNQKYELDQLFKYFDAQESAITDAEVELEYFYNQTKSIRGCTVQNEWCPKENILDKNVTQIYDFIDVQHRFFFIDPYFLKDFYNEYNNFENFFYISPTSKKHENLFTIASILSVLNLDIDSVRYSGAQVLIRNEFKCFLSFCSYHQKMTLVSPIGGHGYSQTSYVREPEEKRTLYNFVGIQLIFETTAQTQDITIQSFMMFIIMYLYTLSAKLMDQLFVTQDMDSIHSKMINFGPIK